MFKRSLVLGLVLSIASVASAGGTWIELSPQTPGPYSDAPGTSVDVDVILHNMEGQTLEPRLVTFDFSATDGSLSLPGTFVFDLSSLVSDGLYSRFEEMPKVDIVYSSGSVIPGFILSIPDGGAMTPELFVRAAARRGGSAQEWQRA